ncbi:MAG TPA: hypothetical protein PLE43_02660 [Alphaproteobacteria bacterium]|nr:hypothetical protein [Alphaproteobacteria bacterium]
MSAIPALTGQSSTPLTQQLRNDSDSSTEFGLTNRNTSRERIANTQDAGKQIASTKQTTSNDLVLAPNQSNDSQPKTSTQRGSLVDLSV